MSRSDDQRIADILEAGAELVEVVNVGYDRFLADPIRIRAAERLLEIIGEAASTLSTATTERYSEVEWRDISRLRIVLAHHYHRVDPEQVWSIAAAKVPELIDQLGNDKR